MSLPLIRNPLVKRIIWGAVLAFFAVCLLGALFTGWLVLQLVSVIGH